MERVDLAHTQWEADSPTDAGPRPQGRGPGRAESGCQGPVSCSLRHCCPLSSTQGLGHPWSPSPPFRPRLPPQTLVLRTQFVWKCDLPAAFSPSPSYSVGSPVTPALKRPEGKASASNAPQIGSLSSE